MGYNFFHENTHPKSFYLKDSTLTMLQWQWSASISQQYLETKRTNTELGSHDTAAFDLQIWFSSIVWEVLGETPTPQHKKPYLRQCREQRKWFSTWNSSISLEIQEVSSGFNNQSRCGYRLPVRDFGFDDFCKNIGHMEKIIK